MKMNKTHNNDYQNGKLLWLINFAAGLSPIKPKFIRKNCFRGLCKKYNYSKMAILVPGSLYHNNIAEYISWSQSDLYGLVKPTIKLDKEKLEEEFSKHSKSMNVIELDSGNDRGRILKEVHGLGASNYFTFWFKFKLIDVTAFIVAIKLRKSAINTGNFGSGKQVMDSFVELCEHLAPCIFAIETLTSTDKKRNGKHWTELINKYSDHPSPVFSGFLWRVLKQSIKEIKPKKRNCHPLSPSNIDLIVDILNFLPKSSPPLPGEQTLWHDYKNELAQFYRILWQSYYFYLISTFDVDNHKISISSRFLIAFFLSLFIREIEIDQENIFKNMTVKSRLECMDALATTIKFYFIISETDVRDDVFCFKHENRSVREASGFLESVCKLVSEYGHVFNKAPKCLELESRLMDMAHSQALFYTTKKGYRDHFPHVLDVCFFGLFIMESRFELVSNQRQALFIKNWIVASLLHDVGYHMELIDVIQKEATELDFLQLQSFWNAMEKDLGRGIEKLNAEIYKQFEEYSIVLPDSSKDKINHGLVSAAHIMDTLRDESLEYGGDKKLIDQYKPAIFASAAHDYFGSPVSIGKEPLAVLLKICDEIQDWERPKIPKLSLRQAILAALRYGNFSFPDPAYMVHEIQLSAKGNPFTDKIELLDAHGNSSSGQQKSSKKFAIILDFTKVKDEEFYVFYSWILKSYRFQDLMLGGLLDVILIFRSKPRTKLFDTDMECLKSARRKLRIWDLEDWFDFIEEEKAYNFDKDKNIEELTLSISKIHERKPIKKDPSRYLDKLITEWDV